MFDILAYQNIRRFVDVLVDVRQFPDRFKMLQRVPIVDALDGEIIARFKGRIYAAAILSLTGKAPLRSAPAVNLQTSNLPIIKHGRPLNREQIRMLGRIEANLAGTQDAQMFLDRVGADYGDLIEGVRTTMNFMLYGMMTDTLAYNRDGVIFKVDYQRPADLKVANVGAALWSNPTTAKPVTDLNGIFKTGKLKYGKQYDRVEMSQTLFDYMIRTDEFRNLAASLLNFQSAANLALPYQNTTEMATLAGRVTGIGNIEIDDWQFFEENEDGSETIRRYLAENTVLINSTQDDNNAGTWDFGNAMVEESLPGMVPAMIGAGGNADGEGEGSYGPFGYATASDPQGNPPGINEWAVASGIPRLYREAATATLQAIA